MPDKFPSFLQKFTFRRQISASITLGILLLAMLSSLTGSWQGNRRVRENLIEQGQHITENLARESTLALIYSSADNAAEAVKVTLAFPGVTGVQIRDSGGKVLLSNGNIDLTDTTSHPLQQADYHPLQDDAQITAKLTAENNEAWHFTAPVYSKATAATPFSDATKPEFLGQVSVVMSKAALDKMTTSILISNLTIAISFALLFLFAIRTLTRNMSRPLEQLSISMRRARSGQSQVRAIPGGPSDIAELAHTFNSMMIAREEHEAASRIAAIAFEIDEAIMVTDAHAVIIRVNSAFTRITGFSPEEVIGSKPSLLKSGRHDALFYQGLWDSLNSNYHWQGEIINKRKDGSIFPAWMNVSAVLDQDGHVTHYIGSFTDITERKQAEQDIHKLAYYDSLSQLPNRRLLLDRLHHSVAASIRHRTGGALIFLDLDNFKALNDTKGHDIGDLLLVEVAKRLQGCVREEDTVSRFGGDEFVLILEGLSDDASHAAIQARSVAEKVLGVLSQPYLLEGYEFHSSSSMGITLFINYRGKLDELLKQADTAMYAAKKSGRNTLRFFDPVMQDELEARTQLEAGMRNALQKQEFRLYYQMQVDQTGKITGAEILLRWIHPERGLISPVQFIPMAEETGHILAIGRWVIESACQQIKTWENDPLTCELQLAVNVSERQFRQPDFVNQVTEIINRSGIDPRLLKLEMTESIVIHNIGDTITKMLALKQTGVRFSMDDFGTGYSSLSYLTQLPLDQLKIDQSFVRSIGIRAADTVIAQTIIGMANNLGMEVIAEGVETQAQRDFLEKAGCLCYQGYLFGKPVPLDEFTRLLNGR
ncbi:MAG: EAL domain-containing protein [Gallionella sp.]|nr:EAL domain-containing protein [Gallionella sp.]MDD4947426.1 EAL domain-containing protein [Gallionella sp.]MDD5612716.1 EAL domain-containing protein [Gallionella sp.]